MNFDNQNPPLKPSLRAGTITINGPIRAKVGVPFEIPYTTTFVDDGYFYLYGIEGVINSDSVSNGKATFTANKEGTFNSCKLATYDVDTFVYSNIFTIEITASATEVPIDSITLTPTRLELEKGQKGQLKVSFNPSSTTSDKTISWSTFDDSVAKVDSNGSVTAIGKGGTYIRATSSNKKIADCYVSVTEAAPPPSVGVQSVTISPKTKTFNIGDTFQFSATVLPNEAENKAVSYESNQPSIASITTAGFLTAKQAGNATITVRTADGNKIDTAEIKVSAPVSSGFSINTINDILADSTGWATFELYTTPKINFGSAEVSYDNGNSWRSLTLYGGGDNRIYGYIMVYDSPKTTKVRVTSVEGDIATSNSFTVSLKNVAPPEPEVPATTPVQSISLNQKTLSLFEQETAQLTYAITPTNATNQKVTFSSSNPSCVEVNVNSGLVTASQAGEGDITITTEDGNKTDVCNVTVKVKPITDWLINNIAEVRKPLGWENIQFSLSKAVPISKCEISSNNGTSWENKSFTEVNSTTFKIQILVEDIDKTYRIRLTDNNGLSKTSNDFIVGKIPEVEPEPQPPTNIPVQEIIISPTSKEIRVGDTIQFSHTIKPSNASIQLVEYESSSSQILSVNSSGFAIANSIGTAIVTVSTIDGNKASQSTIKVLPAIEEDKPPVIGVVIVSGEKPDGSYKLDYYAKDHKGRVLKHYLKIGANSHILITPDKNGDSHTHNGTGLKLGEHTCSIKITNSVMESYSEPFIISIKQTGPTVKESLLDAKNKYEEKYNALTAIITEISTSKKYGSAEKQKFDNAFNQYKTSLANYRAVAEEANNEITTQKANIVGEKADNANASASNAQAEAENALGVASSADGKLSALLVPGDEILLDGGKISANTITGNSIMTGNFTIRNAKENRDTFVVDEDGNVLINGYLESDDFSELESLGYRISPDGDAIFNQAKIRGEVILPNAGITNYGATLGNENLLSNSSKEVGEDSSREFVQYADIAPIFDRYGLVEYTISFDLKSKSTATASNIEVYCQNGNGSKYSFSSSIVATTSYKRYSITTTPTLADSSLSESWLSFFGGYGTGNIPIIKNVKIERGRKATPWCPKKNEQDDFIRFWAGADYAGRNNAPFRVTQNGSLVAYNGTFTGNLYGDYNNGYVHIEGNSIEINNRETPITLYGEERVEPRVPATPSVKFSPEQSLINTDLAIGDGAIKFAKGSRAFNLMDTSFLLNTTKSTSGAISMFYNPRGSFLTAFGLSSRIANTNATFSIGYRDGEWTDTTIVTHSGNKGSKGDICIAREEPDENVDLRIEGNIKVRNAIQSDTAGIEMRCVPNEGWGFYIV